MTQLSDHVNVPIGFDAVPEPARPSPAALARWSHRVHADLVGRLAMAGDPVGVIAKSAEAAAMPGVAHAGALWSTANEVSASAATNPVPHALDRLQAELRHGPGMVALESRYPVVVLDFAADARWPALSTRALALGVRGVICHPLRLPGDHAGALTLYSGERGFTRADVTRPELFAVFAEIALRVAAAESARAAAPVGVLAHGGAGGAMVGDPATVRLHTSSDLLTVVELAGEIDLAEIPAVRAVLFGLPARRTVLDLAGVTFLSTAGLVLLVELHRHLRSLGAQLHLAAPSAAVRKVITLAASAPQLSRVLAPEFRPWADLPAAG